MGGTIQGWEWVGGTILGVDINMSIDKEPPSGGTLAGGGSNEVGKVERFFLVFDLTFSLPFRDDIYIR